VFSFWFLLPRVKPSTRAFAYIRVEVGIAVVWRMRMGWSTW
jgi:hypothetical protein